MSDDKLWSGRFAGSVEELVDRFNASIEFDRRLYREDIRGSAAHVRMLAAQQIIPLADSEKIIEGLREVRREIDAGKMQWTRELEDIHTHVEVRLRELIGPVAGKLHSARSRNDQVILDLRMWLKRALCDICQEIQSLVDALLTLAEGSTELVMPGYTHLQRAQPVSMAHHLHAYVEMLLRDHGRLEDAFDRMDSLPLGAGALAGTTLPIDRVAVARELNFRDVTANSMDSVADRDFVLEFLSAGAICGMHLSRMAEELILWVSQEFAFAELEDSICTGSSMMPQKKNPDLPELVRGKSGRLLGNLVALFTTLKGLPLTYNKDLQEDKEPLFDTVDNLGVGLQAMALCYRRVSFDPQRLLNALESGFLGATDLADYLVQKGLPFREAHDVIGRAVRHCLAEHTTLEKLPLAEYQTLSPLFEADLFDVLKPSTMLGARSVLGGPAPSTVAVALKRSRAELDQSREQLARRRAERLPDLDAI